jgi:hypothetical protein
VKYRLETSFPSLFLKHCFFCRPSNALSISDIALPLVRKSMGVVLQHLQQEQNHQMQRYICTKRSHNSEYETIPIRPDYPPGKRHKNSFIFQPSLQRKSLIFIF